MHPVRLNGQHVTLREFTLDDADAVLALIGDDNVTKWLSFDSRNRAQAVEMIAGTIERAKSAERTEYYLAVEVNNRLVGFARLGLSGIRAAKLGYAIRAEDWGKGYATDATMVMTRFAFTQLSLHRVSAAIGPDNLASMRVVLKAGFLPEGRIRDHVYTNNAWRDSLLFGILEDEWSRRQPPATPPAASDNP